MQAKLMELEMLKQQMGQLERQGQEANAKLMDVSAALQSLEDLGKADDKTEAFVPIGSGIFTKATLDGSGKVVVNVGSNIALEKPVSEARKMMEEMKTNYESMIKEVEDSMGKYQSEAQRIYMELEKAQSGASGQSHTDCSCGDCSHN